MGLLNRDGYYNLSTFSHNTRLEYWTNTLAWQMRQTQIPGKDCDYDYYYLEYKGGNAFELFPLDSFMNPRTLENIRKKKTFLMCVNFHEGFIDGVEAIYKHVVIGQNIPAEQIIIGTGNFDLYNEVLRCSQLYNLPEIRVEIFMELEYKLQHERNLNEGTNPDVMPSMPMSLNTLQHKKYDKKYLCFNRRWRLHRPVLVALLEVNDLLKYGHVSLGNADDNHDWAKTWDWILHSHQGYDAIHELLQANMERIFNLEPLYLDTPDLVTNRATLDTSTDYLYNDTYFSVVTETNYYSDPSHNGGRYLTEKTFKAIACEHPFILVACPNILSALHELGYKTFSPYIDESYDQEYNDGKRLLKIIAEINRLCNLSSEELSEFLDKCKEITNHNLNVLKNKDNFIHKVNYKNK